MMVANVIKGLLAMTARTLCLLGSISMLAWIALYDHVPHLWIYGHEFTRVDLARGMWGFAIVTVASACLATLYKVKLRVRLVLKERLRRKAIQLWHWSRVR